MNITRRQFGWVMLGSFIALIFGRFIKQGEPRVTAGGTRARFWSRADRLAG